MFDKFIIWCGTYKKQIGYTVGTLNLIAALSEYIRYDEMTSTAWLSLVIGALILVDASRN